MNAKTHPQWCNKRLHFGGADASHTAEVGRVDVDSHSGRLVEVGLFESDSVGGRVVLFVAECDGDCDTQDCLAGDGNMVDLTIDQARTVVAQLELAIDILIGCELTSKAGRAA